MGKGMFANSGSSKSNRQKKVEKKAAAGAANWKGKKLWVQAEKEATKAEKKAWRMRNDTKHGAKAVEEAAKAERLRARADRLKETDR